MIYCIKCGFKNEKNSKYCGSCGHPLNETVNYQKETINQDNYNSNAVAGFVLSLCNILFGYIIIFGILGLIYSAIGLNQTRATNEKGSGLAIAGIIISIVTLSLYFIIDVIVFGIFRIIFFPFWFL